MTLGASTPVIIAARRSAIGRVNGVFKHQSVEHLAAPVIQAVLADTALDPEEIDDVILGNAAGPGGNVGRLAALQAGLPLSVPGVTVDRQCGSGLEAVLQAAQRIRSGAAHVVLAGGVESSSTAPVRLRVDPETGEQIPYLRARFSPDAVGDPEMGEAAENVAEQYKITRERQDEFALRSHQKAAQSQKAGRFTDEIVSIATQHGEVGEDSCPRADTSLSKLLALPPVFRDGGTVTAGNACPVNDGAAVLAVVSGIWLAKRGRSPGLEIEAGSAAGVDPNVLGLGPIPAVQKLLRTSSIALEDVDLIEFNEAFAAQVLACTDALGLDENRMNVGGGALAIGHPYGASGAILMVRLFSEMVRQNTTDAHRGLATIGIGGGQGLALLCRRL